MDIKCAKCGEPWDAYGVRNGDMEPDEACKFMKGQGCPACNFGKSCTSCSGTGKEQGHLGADQDCKPCHNQRYLIVRKFRGQYSHGYIPTVTTLTNEQVQSIKILKNYGTKQARDGWYEEYKIACIYCNADPCPVCKGTGKLKPEPDAEEKSAMYAMAADLLGDDEDGLQSTLEDIG